MITSADGAINEGTIVPSTRERQSHLHVVVPLEAHVRARIAAMESGMPFKTYMARLLMLAKPINPTTQEASSEPKSDSVTGISQQEVNG